MKALRLIALGIGTALLLTTVHAQEEASIEHSPTAAQANRAAQRKLEAERRSKKLLEEKPLTYGGFLVELSRSERKTKALSLRQPVDPKNDYKHVYLDERTGRAKGVVLFSVGF
jgi:hypothetical protein